MKNLVLLLFLLLPMCSKAQSPPTARLVKSQAILMTEPPTNVLTVDMSKSEDNYRIWPVDINTIINNASDTILKRAVVLFLSKDSLNNAVLFKQNNSDTVSWDATKSWVIARNYLTSYTETDPLVPSWVKNISESDKSNWNGKFNTTDTSNKWLGSGYVPTWASITGKPTIPAAQVNSDWNSVSGVSQILNKPTLGTAASMNSTAFATAAQGALASTALQAEVDGSVTNEIQSLSLSGRVVSLSSGGGNVTIPYPPYDSLTGKPTIPTNTNQLTNGAGFITQSGSRTAISLTTTGTGSATYNNGTGVLNIPTPSTFKRQLTFTGTTNASGVYSNSFTAFGSTPNIQANIVGGTPNQFIIMTVMTTGFTCTVHQRSAVTILGIEVLLAATTLVNNATVHVLITES